MFQRLIWKNALVQRLTQDRLRISTLIRRSSPRICTLFGQTRFNPFIRKNLAEAYYNVGDRHQAIEEHPASYRDGAKLRPRVSAAGSLV
jgi:hypothetical protein